MRKEDCRNPEYLKKYMIEIVEVTDQINFHNLKCFREYLLQDPNLVFYSCDKIGYVLNYLVDNAQRFSDGRFNSCYYFIECIFKDAHITEDSRNRTKRLLNLLDRTRRERLEEICEEKRFSCWFVLREVKKMNSKSPLVEALETQDLALFKKSLLKEPNAIYESYNYNGSVLNYMMDRKYIEFIEHLFFESEIDMQKWWIALWFKEREIFKVIIRMLLEKEAEKGSQASRDILKKYLCMIKYGCESRFIFFDNLFLSHVVGIKNVALWLAYIEVFRENLSSYRDVHRNNVLHLLILGNELSLLQEVAGHLLNLLTEENDSYLTPKALAKKKSPEAYRVLLKAIGISKVFKSFYDTNDMEEICDLLEAKMYPDDRKYQQHVFYAVRAGNLEALKYYVARATENGKPINFEYVYNLNQFSGSRLIHVAAKEGSLDICNYLLQECHVFLHVRDAGGNLPLHLAAFKCHEELVSLLSILGESSKKEIGDPDILVTNHSGEIPLVLALSAMTHEEETKQEKLIYTLGYPPLLGTLDTKKLYEIKSCIFAHILLSPHFERYRKTLEKVLDWDPIFYWEQAHRFLEQKRIEDFKRVLNVFEEVTVPGETTQVTRKRLVDITRVQDNQHLFHTAVHVDSIEAVDLLIAAGIPVDEPDQKDKTALYWAAENRKWSMMSHLIQKCKANTGVVDGNGVGITERLRALPAIELSMVIKLGHKDLLKLNNLDTETGNTWLHEVVARGDYVLAEKLLEWGVSPFILNGLSGKGQTVCQMVFGGQPVSKTLADMKALEVFKDRLRKYVLYDAEKNYSHNEASEEDISLTTLGSSIQQSQPVQVIAEEFSWEQPWSEYQLKIARWINRKLEKTTITSYANTFFTVVGMSGSKSIVFLNDLTEEVSIARSKGIEKNGDADLKAAVSIFLSKKIFYTSVDELTDINDDSPSGLLRDLDDDSKQVRGVKSGFSIASMWRSTSFQPVQNTTIASGNQEQRLTVSKNKE